MTYESRGWRNGGTELFGVDYVKSDGSTAAHGFDALSDLDSNGDGVFDAQDARYADVRVWRDLNQDGISDAGELASLADHGIASIDLGYATRTINLGNGNQQSAEAAYTRTDGSTGLVANLDFADQPAGRRTPRSGGSEQREEFGAAEHNPFYRQYADSLDTTAVADLLDMQGSGAVRDLREAATLSPTLESQLRTLGTQGYVNRATYLAQVKQLIDAWGGTAADFVTSPGGHILAPEPGTMDAPILYEILYQPPGVSRELLETINNPNGGGTPTGDGTVGLPDILPPEEQAVQYAEWERITHLIETLERFNGQTCARFSESRRWRDGDGFGREAANEGVWRWVA
jgi:hypothetical protein